MESNAWVGAMVRRPRPAVDQIIPQSTPVLSFGNPELAEVATLGINPSRAEFLTDGQLLAGPERRLATLESLGLFSLEQATDEQVQEIVASCYGYFRRNPYWRWFRPLNQLVDSACDASYEDGTACHLDLVQWATEPVWGRLADQRARRTLLDDGTPHLRNQLRYGNVRLVLCNGRAVINQLYEAGLVDLVTAGELAWRDKTAVLFQGASEGVRFLGWSFNLQSSFGVTAQLRHDLGDWIRRKEAIVAQSYETSPTQPDAEGFLQPVLEINGKVELAQVLEKWRASSLAPTIGDIGSFGGRPCIRVRLPCGTAVVLNVDTKRAAVEEYLSAVRQAGPELQWYVVANNRGNVNKVTFHAGGSLTPGWYAYTEWSLPSPQPPVSPDCTALGVVLLLDSETALRAQRRVKPDDVGHEGTSREDQARTTAHESGEADRA